MIVVALLYNTNGMATWCIETAFALYEQGHEVLLVVDREQRPDVDQKDYPFPLFFWKVPSPSYSSSRVSRSIQLLKNTFSGASTGFSFSLYQELVKKGFSPSVFLFNQTDLQDPRVTIPQYVVAWAYPATLKGYLSKCTKQSSTWASKAFLLSAANAINWFRKDWRAYREATGVLAVSARLTEALKAKGVNAYLAYPCLRFHTETEELAVSKTSNKDKIRVLLVAVDLESEQKRIPWVLQVLSKSKAREKIEFHLVGGYTSLPQRVEQWNLNAHFVGKLSRDEVLAYMEKMDLFIFGSSFEDWGYVQVEALSRGLPVIAPHISPSDEIIGDAQLLYDPANEDDLRAKVENFVSHGSKWKPELLRRFEGKHFVASIASLLK